MKKSIIIASSVLAVSFFVSSCVNSGLLVSSHSTQVQLTQANYNVIANSVTGQAKAGYLFGASLGVGMYAQAYALIPLQKDRALYKIAMADLWKKFEEKHGKTEGRSLALVNLRYESEALNTGIYTQPRLTIIADVVEFTK